MPRRPAKSPAKPEPPCAECGSKCCRYTAVQIDRPACKRDYDYVRWYLMHRAVTVFIDHEGDWFVEFESPCEELGPAGRCARYAERPRICRTHGEEDGSCEFFDTGYRERFENARAFERWLDRRGIDWRWKSAR